MKTWVAEMPSNIALIKYMGKTDRENNRPSNSSLSWTLPHLTSRVELTLTDQPKDSWQALEAKYSLSLSEKGRVKFLNHLQRIKDHFGVTEHFVVASSNFFPSDCGIASSASSFAALTEVAVQAMCELSGQSMSLAEKAMLSSKGSGSSCRSFLAPWVLWKDNEVQKISTSFEQLNHMVLLVSAKEKKVSSSEAHQRVASSLLFHGRVERAEQRLVKFLKHLQDKNWSALHDIAWAEFWDMHALFETSTPSFGYFEAETFHYLNTLRNLWDAEGDGPLITMDAGPNIHLLWRPEQKESALRYYKDHLNHKCPVLSDWYEVNSV